MSDAPVKMELVGAAETIGALSGLKNALRNRILRRAVLDATKPVYDEMRERVPEDTKLLRKSIGRKVVVFRNSSVVVGLVGPRTDMGAEVVPRGRKQPIKRVPTRYAHLADRQSPFVAPAWSAALPRAQELLEQRVIAEVEKRA